MKEIIKNKAVLWSRIDIWLKVKRRNIQNWTEIISVILIVLKYILYNTYRFLFWMLRILKCWICKSPQLWINCSVWIPFVWGFLMLIREIKILLLNYVRVKKWIFQMVTLFKQTQNFLSESYAFCLCRRAPKLTWSVSQLSAKQIKGSHIYGLIIFHMLQKPTGPPNF